MFSNHFTTNFSQNAAVKKFRKSVNICQRCGQNFVAYFIRPPCIYAMVVSHCCTLAEVIHFVCLSAACVTCVTLSVAARCVADYVQFLARMISIYNTIQSVAQFCVDIEMSFVTLYHTESLCDVHANLYPVTVKDLYQRQLSFLLAKDLEATLKTKYYC